MASKKDSPEASPPALYSQIDEEYDDEYSQYSQPARRSLPKNRREWKGAPGPVPLIGEGSTATKEASKPQRTPFGGESSTAQPFPLKGSSKAASTTTLPKDPAQQPEKPARSGPVPLIGEDRSATKTATAVTTATTSRNAASSFQFSKPDAEVAEQQPKIVVSKQQRKAAVLSKIYAKDTTKALHKTAPKKIQVKLLPRKPAPSTDTQDPWQPHHPQPIKLLVNAQRARTVKDLAATTRRKYEAWKKKQPPGPPPPIAFSPVWKEKHPYGRLLWAEYQRLLPDVRQREMLDKAKERRIDEAEEERQLPSAAEAPGQAEVREAVASILLGEEPEHLDYEEEVTPILPPPPQPPTDEEMIEDVAEILKLPPKTVVPGPYRNPSPPRTSADVYPPGSGVTVAAKVSMWLHSGQAPSARKEPPQAMEGAEPPPKATEGSQSGSRSGHTSRQQSGKRTHAATGTSAVPPTQRRREVSTSPARDQSPGIERKERLRKKAAKPPVPLIDGFVCKDIAVLLKRKRTAFSDPQWTASFNQPNGQYLYVGAINAIASPSVHLPPSAYKSIDVDSQHPLANETRQEFDDEQSIIPDEFILSHTFGAFPLYAEMITQESRLHYQNYEDPTAKYHDGLRHSGFGITGYDLKGVPDEKYFDALEDQRTALVRFARAAKQAKKCLQIMVDYDRTPPANFDLHGDAIRQLQTKAKLEADHAIHLVMYGGTAMDLVKWLRNFPNTVIGLDLLQLAGFQATLAKYPSTSAEYREADMFRTMLRRIPMRNLVIQSLCPLPIEPKRHYSPHQLLGIEGAFERLTGHPRSGVALLSHSAENLRRIHGLHKDLLRNLSFGVDQRPERQDLEPFIRAMEVLYEPAVARAASSNQEASEGRRASIGEASPMSGVAEGGAEEVPSLPPKQRSQSSKGRRRTPSPTKSKDVRGRASEKTHRKGSSKPVPLIGKEHAQHSTDKKRAHEEKKEHSSRDDHRSKDNRGDNRSKSSSHRQSSTRGSSSHSSRRDAQAQQRQQSSSTRRIVVLTPSPPRGTTAAAPTTELRVVVTQKQAPPQKDSYVAPPKVASQIVAPRQKTPPPPKVASQVVVPPQKYHDYQRPTSSRAPVAERIGFTAPHPHTAKDDLKLLRQRRGGSPVPLIGRSAASEDAPPNHLLKTEPVLQNVVQPPDTIQEVLEATQHHFTLDEDSETGEMVLKANASGLATEELPRAQPETIQITPGCDLPWDPIHICSAEGEHGCFHMNIQQSDIIGIRQRWLKCKAIKKDQSLQDLVNDVFEMKVRSLSQMILIKYGNRFRRGDERADQVLMFMDAVLKAEDLEEELPHILVKYQPKIMSPGATRRWPDNLDFYAAIEHWVCYCEEAFTYLFDRLNGPASWSTDWLESNVLPDEAREVIRTTIVERAQEHFDRLRHQLYLQYGRPHIEATMQKEEFDWKRFDDHPSKRIDVVQDELLRAPTICFVDELTKETFGEHLRDSVEMITVPDTRTDLVLAFIRKFYPTGTVQRVVFWFGRQYIMDRHQHYRDLMADLGHHFATFFGYLQPFNVLPPYMRDYVYTWQSGPLATFVQRAEVAPFVHVVLYPRDLYLWRMDTEEEPPELPLFIDSTGRLLFKEIVDIYKYHMAVVHDLDLWTDEESLAEDNEAVTIEETTEEGASGPLTEAPALSYSPEPTTEGESVPLIDAPTTSTSSTTAAGVVLTSDFFQKNPGFEKLAAFYAQKMSKAPTANIDAQLQALEKALALVEQQDAEQKDEDELSEATPNKERDSEQQ